MFVCATEGMEKMVKERKMVEIFTGKEKRNIYIFRNVLKLGSENTL